MNDLKSKLSEVMERGRSGTRTLNNGTRIPLIGFGTFSDRSGKAETAQAVKIALSYGFRMLDCAAMYNNEDTIGEVLAGAWSAGTKRDELYILSKLPNSMHGRKNVAVACKRSLSDLGLDVLDAYLVHWPVPNALSPEANRGVYLPDSKPYIHESFMETWFGMEELVRCGLVRSIGVSNVTRSKLSLLLRDATIIPSINEMELHPTFQQKELHRFSRQKGVLPIGYSPIGAPMRPERNRMEGDLVDTADDIVVQIAQAHDVSPAAVCIKWAVRRGHVPVPFSSRPSNILANLQAALSDPLTDEEMDEMAKVDANCRLSRGQGYLWPGAASWHELWEDEPLLVD